jgi:CheY-like chemotaxis protein
MKLKSKYTSELAELPDYSSYHLIVAEDDAINFAYITKLLSPTGIKITHASNGEEAVDLVNANDDADLILMDIKMPIMDGYEATESIRKKNISIPIVATTAYAMSGDKEKCLAVGCNAYISKPIKKKELFETISRYLFNWKLTQTD